ncbi:hypothetical protein [Burkholderia plantarii]|uniref:hypothetical protein n=1 Tax=Burkholderia plantarii TaxID=41899 RepID=UPI00114CD735|nr:hypothetical protein [Burkholderia plantarii]
MHEWGHEFQKSVSKSGNAMRLPGWPRIGRSRASTAKGMDFSRDTCIKHAPNRNGGVACLGVKRLITIDAYFISMFVIEFKIWYRR